MKQREKKIVGKPKEKPMTYVDYLKKAGYGEVIIKQVKRNKYGYISQDTCRIIRQSK